MFFLHTGNVKDKLVIALSSDEMEEISLHVTPLGFTKCKTNTLTKAFEVTLRYVNVHPYAPLHIYTHTHIHPYTYTYTPIHIYT